MFVANFNSKFINSIFLKISNSGIGNDPSIPELN